MLTGHKRVKGVPELQDEVKKRVNMTLTPTATEGLDALAQQKGVSRSELVEQIGRGNFVIVDNEESLETQMNFQSAVFPIASLSIERCNELPHVAGVYVVVDKLGAILTGYTKDLHDEFQTNIQKISDFFGSSGIKQKYEPSQTQHLIFWVRCSDKLLLKQLRLLVIHTVQQLVVENSLQDFFKKS